MAMTYEAKRAKVESNDTLTVEQVEKDELKNNAGRLSLQRLGS